MRMRKLIEAGVIESSEPLPSLVYGGDAQQLLGSLAELGLALWVGSMPLIAPIPEGTLPEGAFPYALGNSLFLDIDFPGSEQ